MGKEWTIEDTTNIIMYVMATKLILLAIFLIFKGCKFFYKVHFTDTECTRTFYRYPRTIPAPTLLHTTRRFISSSSNYQSNLRRDGDIEIDPSHGGDDILEHCDNLVPRNDDPPSYSEVMLNERLSRAPEYPGVKSG